MSRVKRQFDAFLLLEGPNGTILAVNPAYLGLFGYPSEQVVGQSFVLIFPPDQRAAAQETYQTVFQAAELTPRFEAVVDESVLHRMVDSPPVMRAQLKRLLELSELPNVTIRVIPYEAGALPAGNNKFIILEFMQPAVPDIVFIEGLTGDLYLEDPRDVEIYNLTYRTLVQLAASPDETREIIGTTIRSHRRGRTARRGHGPGSN